MHMISKKDPESAELETMRTSRSPTTVMTADGEVQTREEATVFVKQRGHNCTPLFALSPAWEQEFLFPTMTFHTANSFDIICRLDRDDTLDDVPQNRKQKVATRCIWTRCVHKTMLGLYLVVPRGSRVQSDVIVLLTSCST